MHVLNFIAACGSCGALPIYTHVQAAILNQPHPHIRSTTALLDSVLGIHSNRHTTTVYMHVCVQSHDDDVAHLSCCS